MTHVLSRPVASRLRGNFRARSVLAAALAGTTAAALLPSVAAHAAPTTPATPPTASNPADTEAPASETAQAAASKVKLSNSREVTANLWEWNWPSVANECTTVLGPKGYGGVQVAPPQNSVTLDGSLGTPVHPWWEVYQPVDYGLTSRMGTEEQFKSMVTTCRQAGVKVYVDAVINHMARDGHASYGGATFNRYEYTGLYSRKDFHNYPNDCPVKPPAGPPEGAAAQITIDNYNDYRQVTKCELLALPDLRTESADVRDTIADYLNKLIGYGVSGFRVDAAKHIGHADMKAIESRLHRTVDGDKPYVAQEVFPGPGELSMWSFRGTGSLLGFDYAYAVHDTFKSYDAAKTGNITTLKVFGEKSGLLPSNKSLVFIENHDTERGDTTLSYRDGDTNLLANKFMLAYGYGRPQVYASYKFEGLTNDSPPSDAKGFIKNTDCATTWACVDRDQGVANMVAWHNQVGKKAKIRSWYDDGVNLIAFRRGTKGWIAINNHTDAQTHTFDTGLRKGTYCDITHATFTKGACSGPTIKVDKHGEARVTVQGKDTVAFTTKDLVRG
ncbi:MAG: alpha-amylase [Janthinobacterium lividum]